MTRSALLNFARRGAVLYAIGGAPNAAALCEAYLSEVAENDLLRRQLASLQSEWGADPTVSSKRPNLPESLS